MSDARLTRGMTHSSDTSVGEVAENLRHKRKRQSQSCDACRARKVRCARDDPENSLIKTSCKHCMTLNIPCTYEYQPKKRGPPNLYLRRLQEAAAAAAAQESHDAELATLSTHFSPIHGTSSSSSSCSSGTRSPFPDSALHLSPSLNGLATPTPHFSLPSNSVQQPYSWTPSSSKPTYVPPSSAEANLILRSNHRISKSDGSKQYNALASPSNAYSLQDWSYKQPPLPMNFPSTLQPLSYFLRPHRLEAVAPRDTIFLVITLFFDYVYPLMPCVHKPSFRSDLHSGREERDPLFFALVMSSVAATLVQVPRSYLPMDRPAVRKLAQACYEASRLITVASYDPPSITHVVIRYLDYIYHLCEGSSDASQHTAFGEAISLAITLRMHEEASYEGLDAIECEIRRRTFWLLFGADKSMAILLGRPVCLPYEDCTTHLPKEVDDDFITSSGYHGQSHGATAIVCGLNYVSRIFSILGEFLAYMRADKRSPPHGAFAAARLETIQSLQSRLMTVCVHIPEPLRLKPTSHPHLVLDYGISGFHQATFAEVKDFFDNPNASREYALNAFLVMQANIHVTQQLGRFVIDQYRDELMMPMHHSIHGHQAALDTEAITRDLLDILHSIPIQSIAINGPSLVHKVRYVASTLLDSVRRGGTTSATVRASTYLWPFISILSEIEKNYLLDDDIDRDPVGDGIPIVTM